MVAGFILAALLISKRIRSYDRFMLFSIGKAILILLAVAVFSAFYFFPDQMFYQGPVVSKTTKPGYSTTTTKKGEKGVVATKAVKVPKTFYLEVKVFGFNTSLSDTTKYRVDEKTYNETQMGKNFGHDLGADNKEILPLDPVQDKSLTS